MDPVPADQQQPSCDVFADVTARSRTRADSRADLAVPDDGGGSSATQRQGPGRLDLALALALPLLTLAVALNGWPVSVDHAVERALPATGTGGPAGVLLLLADRLTAAAAPGGTAAVTLGLAAVLGLIRRSFAPLRFAVTRIIMLLVTVLPTKALLRRPGPPRHPHVSGLHGYFPSGHTATALVCTVTVAVLLAERHPRWRRGLYAAAAGWTALVAAGLVLHGDHWLTDVLGALLLGAAIIRWTPGYRPGHRD